MVLYNFLCTYENIRDEAERRKDERVEKEGTTTEGTKWREISYPAYFLRQQSLWMAQAAIDAFFTWTEHVFIHLAIMSGKLTTGPDIAKLAVGNWHDKFACALDVNDTTTIDFYEKLSLIKQQLRNFMAHGAFGKRGEAFKFHSGVGAVPVLLTEKRESLALRLTGVAEFEESAALKTIQDFIEFLWSGDREPARLYIQESSLPLILPMASDGTYARAMVSVTEMGPFVAHMVRMFEDAANMDW